MTLINPRAHYQKDTAWLKGHQETVVNEFIRDTLLKAYATYCWGLPNTGASPQEALCANAKREGAQQLINTFLTLAEIKPPTTDRLASQLEETEPQSKQFTPPAKPPVLE